MAKPEYASWQNIPRDFFLVFALIIWPVWVPLSILVTEKKNKSRIILVCCLVIGILLSIYMAYSLIFFDVQAVIVSHHISYRINFPKMFPYSGIIVYLIPTLVPAFVSSLKGMKFFGIIMLCSYFVTAIVFYEYVISIWCFFAAILSVTVLFIVRKPKKHHSLRDLLT